VQLPRPPVFVCFLNEGATAATATRPASSEAGARVTLAALVRDRQTRTRASAGDGESRRVAEHCISFLSRAGGPGFAVWSTLAVVLAGRCAFRFAGREHRTVSTSTAEKCHARCGERVVVGVGANGVTSANLQSNSSEVFSLARASSRGCRPGDGLLTQQTACRYPSIFRDADFGIDARAER